MGPCEGAFAAAAVVAVVRVDKFRSVYANWVKMQMIFLFFFCSLLVLFMYLFVCLFYLLFIYLFVCFFIYIMPLFIYFVFVFLYVMLWLLLLYMLNLT